MRHQKVAEKIQFAFATVIYSTERDRQKTQSEISSPKRKQAKTFQFLNEMVVSIFDWTNFGHENYEIS